MFSFDVVFEVNMYEVDNVVDQVNCEVINCFDFKGIKCCFEQDKNVIIMVGDVDFYLC